MDGLREHDGAFRLSAGPDLDPPDLEGAALARTFTSTYFDTEDLRLTAVDITLQRLVENGKSVWELRLPGNQARPDVEAPGGPNAAPETMTTLLAGVVRGRELLPVATLRTRRTELQIADGPRPIASVTLDDVSLMDALRVERSFLEIEIEAVAGKDGARRVARAFRKAGAQPPDDRPLLARALGLEREAQRKKAKRPRELLAAVIAEQLEAIVRNDPGTRLDADPEDLHRLRVATRRLRAILRAAGPLLDPEWADSLRDRLGQLGRALGPARDLDVLVAHLRAEAATLDPSEQSAARELVRRVERRRRGARSELLRALESDWYRELLDDVADAARSPRVVHSDASVKRPARRAFRRLEKAVRALGEQPSDEDLHGIRIRAKRARYAVELAAPTLGKRGARFLRRAKDLQDVLGDNQDAVAAEAVLREVVNDGDEPSLGWVAGRLVERQVARRREARRLFPRAWKRLAKARI